jgi:membrane-associated phospholipid phosphatase
LAAALIVTDYHFVSDVIAGAYLGIVVEMLVYRAMFSNMDASQSRDAAAE